MSTRILFTLIVFSSLSNVSCGWIRATGDSVEAVGDGVGHAVEETGDAVGRAANTTEDEIDEAVN